MDGGWDEALQICKFLDECYLVKTVKKILDAISEY